MGRVEHLTEAVEVVKLSERSDTSHATHHVGGRTYCGVMPTVIGDETLVAANITCVRCRHSLRWRGILVRGDT